MIPGNQYLHAPTPWIPERGYFLKISTKRFSELEESLQSESMCSQAIPKIPKSAKRKWMLCFICVGSKRVTHIARSEVRYPAESGKDKIDIWNVSKLSNSLSLSEIGKNLKGRNASRALEALKGGVASPAAFEMILEVIRNISATVFAEIDALIDPVSEGKVPEATLAHINLAYQLDAVVTVLKIMGMPDSEWHLANPPSLDTEVDDTSLFDSEEDITTVEDLAIFNDLDEPDEDWERIQKQPYPAKTYKKDDTKLTIILANKLELEKQLGVDLIYVNETLKSVVFVQYKMFKGLNGEDGYRPDAQLDEEIRRMDKVADEVSKISDDHSCAGYRFSKEAFFLKFCRKLFERQNTGQIPGYHVPVEYWKRLTETPVAKGLRGGTIVRPETFGNRYFNSTSFIDLVARGWIGTSALQSEVLIPYLKEVMNGQKGFVLAVQSHDVSGDDAEENESG